MASVELVGVSVLDGTAPRLDAVSLGVPDGAFVGVVGGSGSGKTTLLRAIAGLDRVATGAVRIGGTDVTRSTPGERDIGMVFQEPALIGHLSVRRNVSFPLDVRHRDIEEIRVRVDAEARALHIEQLLLRDPRQLSHGEQQMVQIARALVRVPRVLLLDEPFAALDEQVRHRLRAEIGMLQAGYGVTTLMTTNDPADLTALTTQLAVLEQGRLVQFGATSEVRRSPVTLLAAAATGSLSLIDMTVVRDGTGFWLMREDPAGGELVRIRVWSPAFGGYAGQTVRVAMRPEDIVVSAQGTIPAVVERRLPVPVDRVQCSVAGVPMLISVTGSTSPAVGSRVRLRVDHVMAFDPRTDAAIR
ncbi:MAG TPA: ABC transporter ATP-binding protein [Ilumatobacteraceae bacterium]|nr:ABC transporter ATP-binding protein [Ilumatobacteraceae bacterium]